LYKIIIYILIIVIKLLYSTVIYFKIDCNSEETRNVLTFLSFPFPIITGVICIVKYRKSTKAAIAIFVALVLSFISMIAIISAYEYSQHEKYYSGDGSAHIHLYDVSFMDEKGNRYAFDFDKSGYDRFYINGTDEYLNADLCYIDGNGYLHYDDDLSITAKDETVVLLSHKKPDGHINVKVEFGEGEGKVPLDNIAKRAEEYKPKERVTYKMIKEYIEAKYGFKVHTAYIAEVKRDLGLPMYDAPNAVEELKQPRKHPTAEKVEAIKDALKHFEVI